MREGSRYALLFDDLFAATLCGMFHHVMHFLALLCCFMREASRIARCQINAFCSGARNTKFKKCSRKQLPVDGHFHNKAQMFQKDKNRGFPEKAVGFDQHKSFLDASSFVKNKPKRSK